MKLPTPLEAHGTAITAGILNCAEYPVAYISKLYSEETARVYAADIARACNVHDRLVDLACCMLKRLDLEAKERSVFPCAAYREDLRKVLEEATR